MDLEEYYQKKEEEMLACHHLLIKIRGCERKDDGNIYHYPIGSNPDIVKCVKCGFTSEYILWNNYQIKNWKYIFPAAYYQVITNNKVFNKQFGKGWPKGGFYIGCCDFNNSVFNKYLVSKVEFPIRYPELLYLLAKRINTNGTDKELFKIMKKLYLKVMTEEEQKKDRYTMEEVEDLIRRYNEFGAVTLKMRPKKQEM